MNFEMVVREFTHLLVIEACLLEAKSFRERIADTVRAFFVPAKVVSSVANASLSGSLGDRRFEVARVYPTSTNRGGVIQIL